jgi:catechol 1,2-dioxygenase
MSNLDRRDFFRRTTTGLAVLGAGGLWLERAIATEPSGSLGGYARYVEPSGGEKSAVVIQPGIGDIRPPAAWKPTEDNIWGPYFRKGAPFRAKITPPLVPGTTLVVSGRVWGLDTRKPLSMAMLDIWQASATGRYDNDDPNKPPVKDVFVNRARLLTDEDGYYEYETVHPGRYQIGENAWRPSHIHYYVRATGYKPLVTQLYFKGDPMNAQDQFIKSSLIMEVQTLKTPLGALERGVFDVVLEKNET